MLNPLIATATKALEDLGRPPIGMTPTDLLSYVSTKLGDKWPGIPVWTFKEVQSPRNTRAAALEAAAIATEFDQKMNCALDYGKPDTMLFAAQLEAVIASAFDNDMPIRSVRFYQAQMLVRAEVMKELVVQTKLHGPLIKANTTAQLRLALRGSGTVAEAAAGFVSEVLYLCVTPAIASLAKLCTSNKWMAENRSKLLSESTTVAEARLKAEHKLKRLQEAFVIVSEIDKHVSVSADTAITEDDVIPVLSPVASPARHVS